MAQFRLDDLYAIVQALFWLALLVFGGVILYALAYNYGRYIPMFFAILVRRYAVIRFNGFDDFMSSDDGFEDELDGFETSSSVVVLAQQNQENQNQNANFESVYAFLTQHNLTDEQAIIMLSVMRRLSGDDLLSANKIRDIVGGSDAVVKFEVAKHRKPRHKPQPLKRLDRPVNGWKP